MPTGLVRLAAILGGALGVLLFPILTYLWASESVVYGYFGRTYFLVFLGCLSGLAGLYARRRADLGSLWASRPETQGWVFVLMLIGLVLSLVGDVLEYWGGKPGEEFTTMQVDGYILEVWGMLLVLCGSVAFGLVYRRMKVAPGFLAWLLIAAGPVGLVLSGLHMPSGTMLLFCCAWSILGYLLLAGKVRSARATVSLDEH